MLKKDEAIKLTEEVFAQWRQMAREAKANPLVLAAGRKLVEMLKDRLRELPSDSEEDFEPTL
jgi:hypothetical protein